MSLKRLALVNALTFGLLGQLGGAATAQPNLAKPKPLRKGNNGMHVYNGRHAGLDSRYKHYMRRWAPEGGGARECARRRKQIDAGTLRCDVRLIPYSLVGEPALKRLYPRS